MGNAVVLIKADLARYGISNNFSLFSFIKYTFFKITPGIKFSIVFRFCQYYRKRNKLVFYFFYLWLKRIKYAYGFDISYRTQIGKGFYIGHFGGVVIHGDTVIGENCNISQGITIGILNRGKQIGVPKIRNNVFLGPNAVVLGGVSIGNNVLIGANSLVNFDVPDKAVVAPMRSSIISFNGTENYVRS